MAKEEELTKIRTAIVLSDMLLEAQLHSNKNARIADRKIEIANSFGKLSVETGITKSNLISMFAGKSGTKITTLIPVLSALKKTLVEFAKRFEKITDSDIQKFKERSTASKTPAKKKAARKK